MSKSGFNLFFCGTGAADYDWKRYGEEGIAGSCSTLINGSVLIDAGRTGCRALVRFNIDRNDLQEIWFTHSHYDHCEPAEVAAILADRRADVPKLILRGDPALLDFLKNSMPGEVVGKADFLPCRVLEKFYCGDWEVVPLPANHGSKLWGEFPLHYLIKGKSKNMLYALDGAWMTTTARNALSGLKLDLIVWDATVEKPGDWRIYEHNDTQMVQTLTDGLRNAGIVDENTVLVLDHMARTLWERPHNPPKPFIAAFDGMVLDI